MPNLLRVLSSTLALAASASLLTSIAFASRTHGDHGKREQTGIVHPDNEIYRSPSELRAQDEMELRMGLKYLKLIKGDPTCKTIALTFDDGPHPEWTERLLSVLRANKVRATFFVVGKMVDRYPDLIREEIADGNEIANHTYHHLNLSNMTTEQVEHEYRMCDESVFRIAGQHMKYCRPPGGQYDHNVIQATEHIGLTTVLWTDDPGDYAKPGDSVIEKRLLDRIRNGSIILLHDGIEQTLEILPDLIKTLRHRGFKFVTVAEMHQEIQTKIALSAKIPTSRRTR